MNKLINSKINSIFFLKHSHSQVVSLSFKTHIWSDKHLGEINSLEELKPTFQKKNTKKPDLLFQSTKALDLEISDNAKSIAEKNGFDIVDYEIPCPQKQLRPPKIVKIGAISNCIKESTTAPVQVKLQALLDWAREVIHAAHLAGENVACYQDLWNALFFSCTKEKNISFQLLEFTENYETGPTAQLFQEISANLTN